MRALPIAALLFTLASAALAADASKGVVAQLKDSTGKTVGSVTLTEGGGHLMGKVDVSGLTPGNHGMHIHTIGKCEGPAFTTAGGHLNPDGKKHGLSNPQGPHQGDIPQLSVNTDSKAAQNITIHSTIATILDADGASFVIHAGPDDQTTDPSGNSGDRLLCGVFHPIS
jgi:superoxide dismutase, Cu-Zn family